jgi:hypothetical protein
MKGKFSDIVCQPHIENCSDWLSECCFACTVWGIGLGCNHTHNPLPPACLQYLGGSLFLVFAGATLLDVAVDIAGKSG